MEFEEDFITQEDVITIDIDGREFKYRPTTGREETNWLNDVVKVENGERLIDFGKLNVLKLRNIVSVPYSKELINKVIKIDKEWKELNHNERWKLLGSLKAGLLDKLIKAINKYDEGSTEVKKK